MFVRRLLNVVSNEWNEEANSSEVFRTFTDDDDDEDDDHSEMQKMLERERDV